MGTTRYRGCFLPQIPNFGLADTSEWIFGSDVLHDSLPRRFHAHVVRKHLCTQQCVPWSQIRLKLCENRDGQFVEVIASHSAVKEKVIVLRAGEDNKQR